MKIMTSEWFAAPWAALKLRHWFFVDAQLRLKNLLPGAKLTEQEADSVKLSKAGWTRRTAKRASGSKLGRKRKQEREDWFSPAHESNGKLSIVVETLLHGRLLQPEAPEPYVNLWLNNVFHFKKLYFPMRIWLQTLTSRSDIPPYPMKKNFNRQHQQLCFLPTSSFNNSQHFWVSIRVSCITFP